MIQCIDLFSYTATRVFLINLLTYIYITTDIQDDYKLSLGLTISNKVG